MKYIFLNLNKTLVIDFVEYQSTPIQTYLLVNNTVQCTLALVNRRIPKSPKWGSQQGQRALNDKLAYSIINLVCSFVACLLQAQRGSEGRRDGGATSIGGKCLSMAVQGKHGYTGPDLFENNLNLRQISYKFYFKIFQNIIKIYSSL